MAAKSDAEILKQIEKQEENVDKLQAEQADKTKVQCDF